MNFPTFALFLDFQVIGGPSVHGTIKMSNKRSISITRSLAVKVLNFVSSVFCFPALFYLLQILIVEEKSKCEVNIQKSMRTSVTKFFFLSNYNSIIPNGYIITEFRCHTPNYLMQKLRCSKVSFCNQLPNKTLSNGKKRK